jgi:hypothetical protein
MKCAKCENEVAFQWPDDERARRVLQARYYGPLCGTCCGYFSEFNEQLPAGASPVIAMWRRPEDEAEDALLAFFASEGNPQEMKVAKEAQAARAAVAAEAK